VSSSSFAAARILLVSFCTFWIANTAKSQEISSEAIHVRGNVVSRWQINDAEASLLQGDCELAHGARTVRADSMLLLVDGPVGRVRTRFVIAGDSTKKGDRPQTLTLLTLDDPQIIAPRVLKKPVDEPALLRYLPVPDSFPANEWLDAIPNIQKVQFEESIIAPQPDNALPAPPADSTDSSSVRFLTGGGTKSIEIGARDGSTQLQIEMKPRPELGDTVVLAVVGWLPEVGSLCNRSHASAPSDGEI